MRRGPLDSKAPGRPEGAPASFHAGRWMTFAALALWAASLCLPVFRENPNGRVIFGYEALLFAAYLSPALVGLPWLALNVLLVCVSVINFAGVRSRTAGAIMLSLTAFCTLALLAAHALALASGAISTSVLQVGIVPWTVAMLLAGAAPLIRRAGAGRQ